MAVIVITKVPTREGFHVTYENRPVSLEILDHCEVFGKIKEILRSLCCSDGKPITRIVSNVGYQSLEIQYFERHQAVYLKDYPCEIEGFLKAFDKMLAEKMR